MVKFDKLKIPKEDSEIYKRAEIYIRVLNHEIPRAANEYISEKQEMEFCNVEMGFKDSTTFRYTNYKIYFFILIFYKFDISLF